MWKFALLYRGGMDDVVLGMYADWDEAEKDAKTLVRYYKRWETTDDTRKRRLAKGLSAMKPHHPLVAAALDVYSIDVGTYCNISILAFGDNGEPKTLWVYQ
jgi:hypothetical protein